MNPRPARKGRDVLGPVLLGLATLLLVLLLVSKRDACAAEPAASAPASMPAVIPLGKGEPAPVDGLLLPEARAFEYLESRATLEECRVRVSVRDKEIDRMLANPIAAPAPPIRATFWVGLGVGLVVGVVAGAAVLLGGAKLSAVLGGA